VVDRCFVVDWGHPSTGSLNRKAGIDRANGTCVAGGIHEHRDFVIEVLVLARE
jgi:hypothetical protein